MRRIAQLRIGRILSKAGRVLLEPKDGEPFDMEQSLVLDKLQSALEESADDE